MLDGKCLELKYKGQQRLLHPYGIVLRGPKIYLLAVDDRAQSRVPRKELHPAQYFCVRMSNVEISKWSNQAPADFDADKFIARGGLETESHHEAGLPKRGFTLKLRVFDGASDNLLQDLEEFPLSRTQTIKKEKGTSNHILTAPGIRASHQLTEWIVGRLDRVEVLAPVKLRTYIADQLAATQQRYTARD
jgi:hypothetical protein